MKASKAEAKKAQASLSQAESLADLNRKVSLIMVSLKIADVPDDPDGDAAIDADAAKVAGDPKRQKRLEEAAKEAAAVPQSPFPPVPQKAAEKPVRKR